MYDVDAVAVVQGEQEVPQDPGAGSLRKASRKTCFQARGRELERAGESWRELERAGERERERNNEIKQTREREGERKGEMEREGLQASPADLCPGRPHGS